MGLRIFSVAIQAEHDLVLVRQRTRQIAELLGLDEGPRTRLATAVSEISRNAFQYAGTGKVEFLVERGATPQLLVHIVDSGPGIAQLEDIMEGRYRSETGLGLGLAGARRLVDHFEVDTGSDDGTTITLGVDLPTRTLDDATLLDSIDSMTRTSPGNPFGEVLQQNQELLRAQNALAEANRELEAAQAAKDHFLAMLAHELRNLLNALRSSMAVLERRPEETVRQRMEQVAVLQVDHLERLIDDLLDASRIVRGTLEIQRQDLDVVAAVDDLSEAWREQITRSGLVLRVDLPAEPAWSRVDPTRLAQILGNLLSNAEKFSDPGDTIVLGVDSDDTWVTLRVRDEGAGLDHEGLQKIFEPFAQTAEARRRMTGGLGLGLAIVEGLVEAHGGSIEATSDGLGEGTTVAVRLPALEAPAETSVEEKPAAPRQSKGRRLLLVDDHVPTLESLSELLRLEGHTVEVVTEGRKALELAATFEPDVVLCDLGLPGMDGQEVVRRGKTLDLSARWVAVSGFVDPGTREEALAAGFEDVWPKPLDLGRLSDFLEAAAESSP